MKPLSNRASGARVSDAHWVKDLRLVVMENDALRIGVLADKGADIVAFVDKHTGVDFLWRKPTGIRSPKSEPEDLASDEAFNAYYEGGWQELFPHGSSPREIQGVMLPRHGEVHSAPWAYEIVKDTPEEVQVKFSVRTSRTRFALERTMTMNAREPYIRFDERATNLGESDFPIMWGHHPAFGAPFLSGDCAIELPKGRAIDGDLSMRKIAPEGTEGGNMWFLTDFVDGHYGIYNAKLKTGFGMRWDAKVFPVIWIWQGYSPKEQVYACAVEPFTSLYHKYYDVRGRVVVKAGATLATRFYAFAYGGALSQALSALPR